MNINGNHFSPTIKHSNLVCVFLLLRSLTWHLSKHHFLQGICTQTFQLTFTSLPLKFHLPTKFSNLGLTHFRDINRYVQHHFFSSFIFQINFSVRLMPLCPCKGRSTNRQTRFTHTLYTHTHTHTQTGILSISLCRCTISVQKHVDTVKFEQSILFLLHQLYSTLVKAPSAAWLVYHLPFHNKHRTITTVHGAYILNYYLLKAYSPVNLTGSQGFSLNQILQKLNTIQNMHILQTKTYKHNSKVSPFGTALIKNGK